METLATLTPASSINQSLVLTALRRCSNQRWVLSIWTNQSAPVPASRADSESNSPVDSRQWKVKVTPDCYWSKVRFRLKKAGHLPRFWNKSRQVRQFLIEFLSCQFGISIFVVEVSLIFVPLKVKVCECSQKGGLSIDLGRVTWPKARLWLVRTRVTWPQS